MRMFSPVGSLGRVVARRANDFTSVCLIGFQGLFASHGVASLAEGRKGV